MQIVIDISEIDYKMICQHYSTLNVYAEPEALEMFAETRIYNAVFKGTPLPKGHGRLIDADKAIREENSKLVDFDTTNIKDRSYCRYARMILNDAQTIIAADKESEDEE